MNTEITKIGDLKSTFRKAGCHATNIVFALLQVIYGWGALAGGAR